MWWRVTHCPEKTIEHHCDFIFGEQTSL